MGTNIPDPRGVVLESYAKPNHQIQEPLMQAMFLPNKEGAKGST